MCYASRDYFFVRNVSAQSSDETCIQSEVADIKQYTDRNVADTQERAAEELVLEAETQFIFELSFDMNLDNTYIRREGSRR